MLLLAETSWPAVVMAAVVGLVGAGGVLKLLANAYAKRTAKRLNAEIGENAWLRKKIDELSTRMARLEEKYERAQADRDVLSRQNAEQQREMEQMRRQIAELTKANVELHAEVEELRKRQ
jgi:septal ring factor EnvC (AmiA/AmiB activator)